MPKSECQKSADQQCELLATVRNANFSVDSLRELNENYDNVFPLHIRTHLAAELFKNPSYPKNIEYLTFLY
ncbi:hypothetical protein L3V83_15615 [Thiotrichales bacterium 19X7-9]|nr:hypothetical protein [Thiotrichales bacterium 19X7-9]